MASSLAGLLSKPLLYERCEQVNKYLSDLLNRKADLKQFYEFFPTLMLKIFGFDGKKRGWFEDCANQKDAATFLNFMRPSGLLFRAIMHLSDEENLSFMFPTSRLPAPTQQLLMKGIWGQLPQVYETKFAQTQKNPTRVSLDIFEYFMFCFAYFATIHKEPPLKSNNNGHNPSAFFTSLLSDTEKIDPFQLYTTLLAEYVNNFFPVDSPVSSLSSASSSPFGDRTPQTPHRTSYYSPHSTPSASSQSPSSFLHSPMSSGSPYHRTPSFSSPAKSPYSSREQSATAFNLSKKFLLILTEFWLHQNGPLEDIPKVGYVQPTQMMMTCLSMLIYHFVIEYYLKSEFGTRGGGGGRGGGLHQGSLPYLPLTVPLQLIQKPAYDFFKAALTYWPIEATVAFSQVLDVWTSYTQPWVLCAQDSSPSAEVIKEGAVVGKWKSYILSNFLFYTTLFYYFLEAAFQKFDYVTSNDLQYIEKVIYSYNRGDLVEILKEGEVLLTQRNVPSHRLSPAAFQYEHLLRTHCNSLEGTKFEYVPLLYGEYAKYELEELVKMLKEVAELETKKDSRPQDTNTTSKAERIRTLINTIATIFPITPPEKLPKSKYQFAGSPSHQRLPLYAEQDDAAHLTPEGRRQVQLGRRKCSNLHVPYLSHGFGGRVEQELPRPIASWENPAVVRWVYRMAKRFPVVQQNVDTLRSALSYPSVISVFFALAVLYIFWRLCVIILFAP